MIMIRIDLISNPDRQGSADRTVMISAETFRSPIFARLEIGISAVKESQEPERSVKGHFPSKEFKGIVIKFLSTGSVKELQIRQSIGFRVAAMIWKEHVREFCFSLRFKG